MPSGFSHTLSFVVVLNQYVRPSALRCSVYSHGCSDLMHGMRAQKGLPKGHSCWSMNPKVVEAQGVRAPPVPVRGRPPDTPSHLVRTLLLFLTGVVVFQLFLELLSRIPPVAYPLGCRSDVLINKFEP
jgi:hypothetical protein